MIWPASSTPPARRSSSAALRRCNGKPRTRSSWRPSRRSRPSDRSRSTRSSSSNAPESAIASKDNGVLIVVAVEERRVRIEVGYGLEETITDGFSGDTIRQDLLPGVPQRPLRPRSGQRRFANHSPDRRVPRRSVDGCAGASSSRRTFGGSGSEFRAGHRRNRRRDHHHEHHPEDGWTLARDPAAPPRFVERVVRRRWRLRWIRRRQFRWRLRWRRVWRASVAAAAAAVAPRAAGEPH